MDDLITKIFEIVVNSRVEFNTNKKMVEEVYNNYIEISRR